VVKPVASKSEKTEQTVSATPEKTSEIAKLIQKTEQTVSAQQPEGGETSGFGVQLASYGSKNKADEGAKTFMKKFPELSNYSYNAQKADVKGKTYYRVRFFGFADKSKASKMCSDLKSKGQGCFPVSS